MLANVKSWLDCLAGSLFDSLMPIRSLCSRLWVRLSSCLTHWIELQERDGTQFFCSLIPTKSPSTRLSQKAFLAQIALRSFGLLRHFLFVPLESLQGFVRASQFWFLQIYVTVGHQVGQMMQGWKAAGVRLHPPHESFDVTQAFILYVLVSLLSANIRRNLGWLWHKSTRCYRN